MDRRVVVTGAGAVSALGTGFQPLWEGLIAGQTGIRAMEGFQGTDLKVRVAAQVPGFEPERHFSAQSLPLLDRHTQFALLAAEEAVAEAGLEAEILRTAGAVIATGCGGKETDEETYRRLYREGKKRVHPLTIPRGMPSAAASQVSIQLGIAGPVFTVSSACASANHAVAQAALMIRSGVLEVAIAGGSDAPFTYGLLKSWEAMRVLSPDTCRPFSADRSGLVLGEGAGMLVLESLDHARRRGAEVLAELAGFGMSSDAAHITAPAAEGAARAIRSALEDAAVTPEAVGYVNAHGTGTQINDVTETQALHQAFGDHAARLAVSSTKWAHGHALGASGGLELLATIQAVRSGVLPPTANFTTAGEGCDLDYIPNQAREREVAVAVSNSFAFGGLNAVLVVRRV